MTERAEIEAILQRLVELRRAASSDDLRSAYQAAIDRLDAVAYRLAQLRAPEPGKPAPHAQGRQAGAPDPFPAPPPPKAAAPARATPARIVVARKPRRG